MNDNKRKRLDKAIDHLNTAIEITESVRDQEEEDMENMPESFQSTERYDIMSEAVESLEEAVSAIEEAIGCIETASA